MDLVRGLDRDEFKASIVRHLVAMAHDNGIKVVGEGVETEAEARALREYEVDYLQGFLFAKPAPISEFMQARAA